MCRHLAYLGPPRPVAWPLFEAPHALVRQAWAPRDMRGGGTINVDGFGAGWYPGAHPTESADGQGAGLPVRYRREGPMWADAGFAALAGTAVSGCLLAAVRSATVGMPVHAGAAAPFVDGPWLFSHNGVVAGWPGTVAKLAERLPVTDLLTLDAPTDSALLWALVRDRLRSGASLADAVAVTVAEVAAAAPGSRLNLLLTDGTSLAASTAGHSLAVRETGSAVDLCSEPLDDGPHWRPIPDRSLVTAGPGGLTITPLGDA